MLIREQHIQLPSAILLRYFLCPPVEMGADSILTSFLHCGQVFDVSIVSISEQVPVDDARLIEQADAQRSI